MFKKILFATDASPACDAAAKIVFELSEKYESDLVLLHVDKDAAEENSSFVPDMPGIKKASQSGPDPVEGVGMDMKGIYGPLLEKNKAMAYRAFGGEPAEKILDMALTIKADCIIMGACGREENPGGTGLGQTAGKTLKTVIKKADCPVLSIARPCETCFWYFNQIVFGTDFSKASMAAFEFAYRLADYIGCKLHIFHALKIDRFDPHAVPGQKQIEDQIQEAKNRIEEEYVSQMKNFDNYDTTVWEGCPYIEILKFSRETRSDLIVMGCHNEDGDSGAFAFGSTIEQVLLRSACPVISLNSKK